MLSRMLQQPCRILTPTKVANGFGTPKDSWATPGTQELLCRLQLAAGSENLDGRDLSLTQWKLFLPPDAVISPHDRVAVDEKVLEVVSVYPVFTPRGLHHFEVMLATFSGGVPSA